MKTGFSWNQGGWKPSVVRFCRQGRWLRGSGCLSLFLLPLVPPSYGKDVEDGLYFGRMTGWDADNNAVDYGGAYTDAAVTANGTYTVSLTCGDMAYGPDTFFRMLYVSTDIPSAAVEQEVITISDITVKFGEGKTQALSYVNTSGDYARITLIDEYDSKVPAELAYTMPAAGETITISFTVSGLAD